MTRFLLLSDVCGYVVGRPSWWEDVSVIHSYKSLSGSSPTELMTTCYCLIWDCRVPFCRFFRHPGLRWRYSNPPPHVGWWPPPIQLKLSHSPSILTCLRCLVMALGVLRVNTAVTYQVLFLWPPYSSFQVSCHSMYCRMIGRLWIMNKTVLERGCDALIWGTIPGFAWRDWLKPCSAEIVRTSRVRSRSWLAFDTVGY
jgi:hypothetical protein